MYAWPLNEMKCTHFSAAALEVTETCFSGVYNETAFRALDYILDTAAYNGVKLIFTMGDNWQAADSKMNVSYYHPLQPQTKLARSTFLLHSTSRRLSNSCAAAV